jgi:2-hydroxychromene-2-carboxylate isomerase
VLACATIDLIAIEVTHFSDPGCPWAYSESPALAVLRWRYGDGLRWRLVTIGLAPDAAHYERRGYTPAQLARGYRRFRRYGMPFTTAPRRRIAATARACRAIVAVRLSTPEREPAAFRALQFGWFTTDLVLDEDDHIRRALEPVPGIDAAAVVARIDHPDVVAAYERDRAEARSAAGSPTEFQGKARNTDGDVRYSAPSLVFSRGDRRLEAGGFQPVGAYDVLVANLDTSLERRPPPDTALAALERFPDGLVTQEVAAIMAAGNDEPDRAAAEEQLIDHVASGDAIRVPLGDDALWLPRAASAAGAERRRAA